MIHGGDTLTSFPIHISSISLRFYPIKECIIVVSARYFPLYDENRGIFKRCMKGKPDKLVEEVSTP